MTEVHEATLAGGARVVFRPIVPEDKALLQKGLTQLSDESRYLRFFSPLDHFTERQLRYLTEIDYVNHFAWVAAAPEEQRGPGIGVARWIRLPDHSDMAEGAVTVIDAYQGQGIGKTLLWLAARSAIERGIRCFQFWTMAENEKAHRILEDLGARPGRVESGTQDFLVPLPERPEDLEGSPAPLVLRAVAEGRVPPPHEIVSGRGAL